MANPITELVFSTVVDTPVVSLSAGDSLDVTRTGGLLHYATSGFNSQALLLGGQNTVTIAGAIAARGTLAISGLGGNTITIAATGTISSHAQNAFQLDTGGNIIFNHGSIAGFGGIGGGLVTSGNSNTVTNTGSIVGIQGGLGMDGTGHVVDNSGVVQCAQVDSAAFGMGIGGGTVTNSGTIQGYSGLAIGGASSSGIVTNAATGVIAALNGAGIAVEAFGGNDTVTNNGLIKNAWSAGTAVSLGGGADTYNGQLGQAIGLVKGGAGNDNLNGGAQIDKLYGEGENDTLAGGGAADTLDGGAGNDTFNLGAEASGVDTVIDASGTDTILSTITRSLSFAAYNVIENLILQGAGSINGTGNASGNSIVGNSGSNILAGLDGNDVLVGGGGNDQLFGQAGKDSLTGGLGNDRFAFASTAQTAPGLGDVIVDLDDAGDDVIDLTGIIPGVLTFIGQVAFTAANQVRYQQVGANVLVQINTTGPNGAEGEITLLNTTIGNGAIGQVNAADFLL